MAVGKYLLVRPRGGLNDNLTQLQKAWQYAEKFGRTLIIDTEGSLGFNCAFSKVFDVVHSQCPVECSSTIDLENLFSRFRVLPHALQGLTPDYLDFHDSALENFVHADSGSKLSFDFRQDHPEELIVHQQCGGGVNGFAGLARLRFGEEIRSSVINQLKPLAGKSYLALHIRHSDYRTDYKAFFDSAAETILSYQHCLLCTDSKEVSDYARSRFGSERILQFGVLPETGGTPLHLYAMRLGHEGRKALLFNQFADLLGLALGEKMLGGKLTSGGLAGYSGFFVLASGLRQNPWIIAQLLGRSWGHI